MYMVCICVQLVALSAFFDADKAYSVNVPLAKNCWIPTEDRSFIFLFLFFCVLVNTERQNTNDKKNMD